MPFTLAFTSNGHPSADSASIAALNPGAATTLTFTTPPASTGSVDAALSTQPVIHVVDQYGDPVIDGTGVTVSIASGGGAFTAGDTLIETHTRRRRHFHQPRAYPGGAFHTDLYE